MFQIDQLSRIPVYEQLIKQLEGFLLNGIIKPGDQLPSVRCIASEQSINPRTILKAYSDLDSQGLITSVPGKGYFVCEDAMDKLKNANIAKLDSLQQTLKEMALAGVLKEKVIECVNNAYNLKQ